MFLSLDAITRAYEKLYEITPGTDGKNGKKAGERASAIRYFLATAAAIERTGASPVPLGPDQSENRLNFIKDIGAVVRLDFQKDTSGPYTGNFKSALGEHENFGAVNNFLTTSLLKDGGYPSRPKGSELITKQGQSVSLHPKWQTHLRAFGNFESYAAGLVIWLVRFEDLGGTIVDAEDCLNQIESLLIEKYGSAVVNMLLIDRDAVKDLLVDDNSSLSVAPNRQINLTFLVERQELRADRAPLANESMPSDSPKGENVIYYGAPGTGKSYRIKQRTDGFDRSQVTRTVFHSEYQNSDFMGSLQPSIDDIGNPTYEFTPGPFIKAFINAMANPDEEHVLIIEELNRANAASVFGDVFQLLDRDESGKSQYSVEPDEQLRRYVHNNLEEEGIYWDGDLILPKNLSILATMNSADQGVLPMDSAFKRRWRFEYLPIDYTNFPNGTITHAGIEYEWRDFARAINAILIGLNVEEDKLLGPWFLSMKDLETGPDAVSGKLFVYLWDDVLRHLPRRSIFASDGKSFGTLTADYLKGNPVLSAGLVEALTEVATGVSEIDIAESDSISPEERAVDSKD
mgnify:CR=1 FL=1